MSELIKNLILNNSVKYVTVAPYSQTVDTLLAIESF